MANSADPDQLASSEAKWYRSTLFAITEYSGSAGLGLKVKLYCTNILGTVIMYTLWQEE